MRFLQHMIFISTHLLEEVLPKFPLRQWVLSVPKWLRYHLTKDAALASQVLRIFIDEIEKQLKKSCDGITEDAKLGAVSFIQRFGSRLNLHIHFHCVVLDGLFYSDEKGTLQFADVYNLGKEDSDKVEARVRKRVLSLFKRRAAGEQIEDWCMIFPIATAKPGTLLRAVTNVQKHQLSFWDAMLWSTARDAGVSVLLSEDFNHHQEIAGMKIINPIVNDTYLALSDI